MRGGRLLHLQQSCCSCRVLGESAIGLFSIYEKKKKNEIKLKKKKKKEKEK